MPAPNFWRCLRRPAGPVITGGQRHQPTLRASAIGLTGDALQTRFLPMGAPLSTKSGVSLGLGLGSRWPRALRATLGLRDRAQAARPHCLDVY